MKMLALLFAVLLPTFAFAGDDPVTQVAYTGTAGCSAALKPKTKYAVQPTTDAYVRVTSDTTNATATSNSVKVAADKLYDVATTSTQTYVCCVQVSASGTCKIFLFRGPTE
jgi:hypothetical protein